MSKLTFIYTYEKREESDYSRNNSTISINHIVEQETIFDNPSYMQIIDINKKVHIIKAIDFYEQADIFKARE